MTSLVWPTGRSSRWYGTCDICGATCREMYIRAAAHTVQTNTDGSAHVRPALPWQYGHHACVTAEGRYINVADLPRVTAPGSIAWHVPAAQAEA